MAIILYGSSFWETAGNCCHVNLRTPPRHTTKFLAHPWQLWAQRAWAHAPLCRSMQFFCVDLARGTATPRLLPIPHTRLCWRFTPCATQPGSTQPLTCLERTAPCTHDPTPAREYIDLRSKKDMDPACWRPHIAAPMSLQSACSPHLLLRLPVSISKFSRENVIVFHSFQNFSSRLFYTCYECSRLPRNVPILRTIIVYGFSEA